MLPTTIHGEAQLIRHARGWLTSLEKWVAQTPPDQLGAEITDAISQARRVLTELDTALSLSRPSAAPVPPMTTTR